MSNKACRHVYIVTEHTLVPMLLRAALRQPVFIFRAAPALAFLRPLFGWLTGLVLRHGWVEPARQLAPDREWFDDKAGNGMLSDYFPRIEARAEAFVAAPERLPGAVDGAYAERKAGSFYVQSLIEQVYLADWLDEVAPDGGVRLVGISEDFEAVRTMCRDQPLAAPRSAERASRRLPNLANLLVFGLGMAGWALLRLRPEVDPAHFRLAADTWSPHDGPLLAELVDHPEELLVVERNAEHRRRDAGRFPGSPRATRGDGRFAPGDLAAALGTMVGGLWRTWKAYGACDPALFYAMLTVPLKRLVYRGFFLRFRPQAFWGRDDYAIDHILRNQELRRVGGRSLGINHGLPVNIVDQAWRHIDFDVYYTYGRHLYETYYRDVWPHHMTVRPVGTPLMTRAHLARLDDPRPPDIVYFVSPRPENAWLLDEMYRVAEAFPDRRVLVKLKASRRADGTLDRVLERLRDRPANLAETVENTYDLLCRVRYAISPGSTVVAEAAQYDVASFVFDVPSNGEVFYFRDFPGLCVASGAEFADRVRAIEAGTWAYPWPLVDGLIDRSRTPVVDVIRADMGLPPRADRAQVA